MQRRLSVLAAFFLISSPAFADGATRQAEAHVHGNGNLTLALEDRTLTLELFAAGANFAFRGAEVELSANDETGALFLDLPKSAGCSASSLHIETSILGEDDKSHHHDHDDHHDHEEAEDSHAGHTDRHLTFSWACASPDKLKQISVKLFETFSGFEKVDALFLTDDGARAEILTPTATQIKRP